MKTEMKTIIIPDFMILLRELNKKPMTAQQLHYGTLITYKHIHDIKQHFKEKKWVTIRKEGREQYMTLTGPARDIVSAINALLLKLGIDDNNIAEFRRLTKLKKVGTDEPTEKQDGIKSKGSEKDDTKDAKVVIPDKPEIDIVGEEDPVKEESVKKEDPGDIEIFDKVEVDPGDIEIFDKVEVDEDDMIELEDEDVESS